MFIQEDIFEMDASAIKLRAFTSPSSIMLGLVLYECTILEASGAI